MKVGDTIENFSLKNADGVDVTLEELLAEGPIVLFFYPKAFTAGCTAESCHFRDMKGEIIKAGAHPVGISADRVQTQADFAQKYSLDYPLLSDPEGTVAQLFGVRRAFPAINKRMTFVIDTDRVIRGALKSELNMNKHADEAMRIVQGLTPQA